MKLRPVNYTWKDNDRKDLGFIAQEIREILPELVMESKDSMNTLLMNYQGVIPVLVKAIQEQQAEIQQLKEENKDIQALKASVAEKDKQFMQLQQEIEKMKQFLGMSLEAKKN
jgi:septal ring factor EnvC (AmiA/AmiB activator)